jgi:prolyl oligopeptidase
VSRDGTLVAYWVREGGADETTVHVFNVKTGKTLQDELPSANLPFGVLYSGRTRALLLAHGREGLAFVRAQAGASVSRTTRLLFGNEFRGEELGPSDLILAYVTDDCALSGGGDRPRRAGKARRYCVIAI